MSLPLSTDTFGRTFAAMNFLSVDQVSKTWHDKPVLREVTFGIQQGEKVALVAGNGSFSGIAQS